MNASNDNPGVIAPPPLLFGTALAAGLAVDFLLLRAPIGLPAALRYGVATICVVAGVVLLGGALAGFRRAGTRAEPWRPSTAIVSGGVYGYTRNPMYLGMALVYAAISVAADSLISLLFLVVLLVVVQYGVILREERYLEAKFGDEYRLYKCSVRRWI